MMSFSVWTLLLVLSVSLVACTQAGAYSIKDSGVPASRNGDVAWLDDHRVVFYQLKIGKDNKNLLEPFIWDTANNSVSLYPALQGSAQLRVCGEFISYIRRKVNLDFTNEWLLIYGKLRDGQIAEDQVIDFPNPSAINPFSCRYYKHPYPWTVKGRNTTPLLEEHGFLDFGPDDLFSETKRIWTLYRPGVSEGIRMPLPDGVAGPMGYEPFRHAYLFVSMRYRDPVTGRVDTSTQWPEGKPVPIWWLTPDGTVTQEAIPYHPLIAGGRRDFLPVNGGVFVGGYFVRDGTTRQVIAGLLHKPVVSPDGCRIAFVHEPNPPTDVAHSSTVKVKMIDFCNGGTHE